MTMTEPKKQTAEVIEVFADGACRGNGKDSNVGAWAYILRYKGHEKKDCCAVRNTTNNIMELTSCINALLCIKDKSLPVRVYMDSQYVIKGMNEWIQGWIRKGWRTSQGPVKNKELWMELLRLKEQFSDIVFVHVAGHADCEGNNEADRLCNEAMDAIGA